MRRTSWSRTLGILGSGLVLIGLGFVVLAGCGRQPTDRPVSPSVGRMEAAFRLASQTSGVPERLLMAIAWVESGLNPDPSSATYINPAEPDAPITKDLRLGQSAVGVTLKDLGLESNPDASKLDVQLGAYGKWVRAQLDAKGLKMAKNLPADETMFQWIWQLAQLHRAGKDQRRNIRIIFAREIIDVLNHGFLWQDPQSAETLRFPKEDRPLVVENMSPEIGKLMTLSTDPSDIGNRAVLFEMPVIGAPGQKNNPRRIEVIHCPLSLSACLELQNPMDGADDGVRMGAHYVIPRDERVVERVLQVSLHDSVVESLTPVGDVTQINDAIVIMLVGNSGRYINGKRAKADPTWITSTQLETMGKVIRDVCTRLEESNSVDARKCMTPFTSTGVTFRAQGASEAYQWGQIADFDRMVFGAYTISPDGLAGETALETNGQRKSFRAGSRVDLNLRFPLDSALVEMERLVRCPDKRLVWSLVESIPVFNMTRQRAYEQLWDSGPNASGEQFYRLLAYGSKGDLLGWSVSNLYIEKYRDDIPSAPPKACF